MKARELAGEFEKADSWADRPAAPPLPESVAAPPRGTIEAACLACVANRKAAGLKPPTLRKYNTFAKQIGAFADDMGYVMLDQFTPSDIDRFWTNWKLGPRAKGKRLTTLRALFRFCVNRKWIPESPD